MRDAAPQTIHLADYTPPAFLISTVGLDVDIRDGQACVHATLKLARNPAHPRSGEPLVLDGEDLELLSVALDGRALGADEYRRDDRHLTIPRTPEGAFTLETTVRFDPWNNTKLEGLYASKDGLVTQCEAEGFRHITYFIDRPDVMARYAVTLCAEKARFPRLLANGNLVAQGEGQPAGWFMDPSSRPSPQEEKEKSSLSLALSRKNGAGEGRHWARWEDPFPKPSYLFAMVAAKLDLLEDHFTTRSGKRALLQIYVEPGKLDQAGFAMQALKKCMRWDEEVFGLELDLERFMIVAVSDFNAGAMENKGLNIFNTRYVLARADTATDYDYYGVDRVVAHEYFHNWTGNRVTCRDWFQLSLKEGLTVYRDQEYSADEYSRPVARIQEVRSLRERQFSEDAGPMAHPVRPDSYQEVNNFYTATVYDKGAEVVRMYEAILGKRGFRRGMDLYFKRHDGQAVTCDDFRAAMSDANGKADLAQFERWYSQGGTPLLECSGTYDAAAKSYRLRVKQSCPPTPGQPRKEPFVVPFAVGMLDAAGDDMPLTLAQGKAFSTSQSNGAITTVLAVTEADQEFVFADVAEAPVPSLLRGFSAPVKVVFGYTDAQLAHLLAHDSDPFARWEAGQELMIRILLKAVEDVRAGREVAVPGEFAEAVGHILTDGSRDPAFAAECLQPPGETFLAECMDVADPEAIHLARRAFIHHIAANHRTRFEAAFRHFTTPGPYSPDAGPAGRRSLRNTALSYVSTIDDPTSRALAFMEFRRAENMTDAMAALVCLANCAGAERERALEIFYDKWKDEALVVDKWFSVQATSIVPGAVERVKALAAHPAFDLRNPNRARSLLHAFAMSNPRHFHAADGSGYRWIAEQTIALDKLNPQVASRLARAFDRWKKYDAGRQAHAKAALESIRDAKDLSPNVAEVVGRALG